MTASHHRATPEDWADAGAFATPTRACLLEVRARIEELEARQQEAKQQEDPQTLHSVALQMVDTLGRSFGILPEILDLLRRAIREPIEAQPLTDGADAQAPASLLIDTVAGALSHANGDPMELWRSDAVIAAFAVAAWIEHMRPDAILNAAGWAELLRREVQR